MKTAMQELIEFIESTNNTPHVNLTIMDKAKNLLEKEKEQIITDYSNGLLYALGYKNEDKNIEYGVIMQSKGEADIYYNEKYNQNK